MAVVITTGAHSVNSEKVRVERRLGVDGLVKQIHTGLSPRRLLFMTNVKQKVCTLLILTFVLKLTYVTNILTLPQL